MAGRNIENVCLSVTCFTHPIDTYPGNDAFVDTSQNTRPVQRQRSIRDDTPPLVAAVLQLSADDLKVPERLKAPGRGIYFGSGRACDILLALDNTTSVSNLHFRLCFDTTLESAEQLNLYNVSDRNCTWVNGRKLERQQYQGLRPDAMTSIIAGQVSLQVVFSPKAIDAKTWQAIRQISEHPPSMGRITLKHSATETPLNFSDLSELQMRKTEAQLVWDSNSSYKFLDKIYHGKKSSIWKLQSLAGAQEIFVVKVITRGPLYRESVVRPKDAIFECLISGMLNDRHVVAILDSATTHDQSYIVMDLARHGSLEQWERKNRPVPEQKSRQIMNQIWLGLAYLHDNAVIHRDLSLANVLIYSDAPWHCKITDFGTAVMGQSATGFIGTPRFMAPEVAKAYGKVTDIEYDSSADVWSSGIIAYALATSDDGPPTCGLDELFENLTIWEPNHLDHLSESFRNLILSTLEKEPSTRLSARDCVRKPHPLDTLPPMSPNSLPSTRTASTRTTPQPGSFRVYDSARHSRLDDITENAGDPVTMAALTEDPCSWPYQTVSVGEVAIYVRSRDCKVNFKHIAGAAGKTSSEARKMLEDHSMQWDIVNTGSTKERGRYVDMQSGIKICEEWKLAGLRDALVLLRARSGVGQ